MSTGREREAVGLVAQQVDIRARSLAAPVRSLSGGNQQKTLFAKWRTGSPRVLIADEPTRGVDVGAKAAIHDLLASLARDGTAVILISSEFDEVIRLAERVVVLRGGRTVAELSGPKITSGRCSTPRSVPTSTTADRRTLHDGRGQHPTGRHGAPRPARRGRRADTAARVRDRDQRRRPLSRARDPERRSLRGPTS